HLVRRDLARQPDRAPLLEFRDVQTGFDAGGNVIPAFRCGDVRALRQSLRAEGTQRALCATAPLPKAFVRIVDVRIDVPAGELHGRLGAALERNISEFHICSLFDHAGENFVGILRLRAAHLEFAGFAAAAWRYSPTVL